MPVDLDDQLAALGTALLRDSAPITLAELRPHRTPARPRPVDAPQTAGEVDGAQGMRADRPRRWAGAAAVATAAASLVALILVVDRGGPDGSATSVPEPGQLEVEGVLGLDPTAPVAAGWTVQAADAVMLGPDGSGQITRRYATASPTPETGPALDVVLLDETTGLSISLDRAPDLEVQGSGAWWLDEEMSIGRDLAVRRDGRWLVVRGYHLTDDQVVTATEHVEWSADGFGAVVGAAGLPAGVVEQYVSGGVSEMWLLPLAPTRDIPMIRWTSGDRVVWLQSVPANEAFVRAQRIGATTVADVTVDGSPSFVATWEPQPELRWMAWTDGASSYLLGANELSSDELVAFAEALAPLTVDQWDALLASSRPAESDLVRVGVEQFPIVDAALIPDADRRGRTFGSYAVTADASPTAFPLVVVHGGVVTIAVNSTSAPDPGAGWAQAEPIGGRPAFLVGSDDGLVDLVVDLGDGTWLDLSTSVLTAAEIRAVAEAVELVDRATWEAHYEPEPPARSQIPPETTSPVATLPSDRLEGTLAEGSTGDDVVALQERLSLMGFDPGPADGVFGEATEQAVWAFEKLVLGMPREQATGVVTPEMWERLQAKISIKPRRPQADGVDHVEIYLPEQVLVVFHGDQPVLVTHVSTGMLDDAGEPAAYCETITIDTDSVGNPLPAPEERSVCGTSKTPGGVFDVTRSVTGERIGPLGGMRNPVYFNVAISIHGALNVPLQPVSHGNVRVPMHVSDRIPDLIPVGTSIYVWDGTEEPEAQTRDDMRPDFAVTVDPAAGTSP